MKNELIKNINAANTPSELNKQICFASRLCNNRVLTPSELMAINQVAAKRLFNMPPDPTRTPLRK